MEQTKKPSQKKTNWFGAIFFLISVALTLYLVLKDHNIDDIYDAMSTVNPLWLGLAAVSSVVSLLLLGVALYVPIRELCGKKVGFAICNESALTGFFYSAITPSSSGGQPMQLYFMCKGGLSVSDSSLGLLCVNIAYQSVVLLFPGIMFILKTKIITENVHGYMWLLIFGVLVSLAVIFFIGFAMFSKRFGDKAVPRIVTLLNKLHIVKDKEKVIEMSREQLTNYHSGAAVFRQKPMMFIRVFIIYWFQLAAQFAVPYFIYRSFGLDRFGFFDVLALQSVLYLAVCFLPLPGAQGATESAFITLFRFMFLPALLVPATLLSRAVSFYLPLIISGVATLILSIRASLRAKRQREITAAAVAEVDNDIHY